MKEEYKFPFITAVALLTFLIVVATLFWLRLTQESNDKIPANSVDICQKVKVKISFSYIVSRY